VNSQANRLRLALEAMEGMEVRLNLSLTEDAAMFPVTATALESPDSELIKTLDAFLKRFEQTADHLLRKLFPLTIAAADASREVLPFRDVLDRLHRFSLIDEPATWVSLNELRNRLVHDYALDNEELAADLSAAWHLSPMLLQQVSTLRQYASEHGLLAQG
jgi:hypothetical protein